jgi:hypothetical protein
LAKCKILEEAHRLAGYTGNRSTASILKRNPHISARIDELLEKRQQMDIKATDKPSARWPGGCSAS